MSEVSLHEINNFADRAEYSQPQLFTSMESPTSAGIVKIAFYVTKCITENLHHNLQLFLCFKAKLLQKIQHTALNFMHMILHEA